jgi:hypothetical protein
VTEPESAPEDLPELEGDNDNFLEHGQVGQFHVPFSDMGDLRNGVLAGLLSVAVTDGNPVDVGLSAFAAAVARVKKLRPDEVVALSVLKSLVGGGSIYRVRVNEERLVARLKDEHVDGVQLSEGAARRLLADMQSRGILEEGAGQWRAVW